MFPNTIMRDCNINGDERFGNNDIKTNNSMTKDCKDTELENCVISRLNSLDEQLSTLKKIMARMGFKMRNSTIPTWNNKTDNVEYR